MKVSDVYFDKGDILYNEGDETEFVYLIEEGQVEMFRQRGERQISVQVMGVGLFVGEIGVLERKRQPLSARAHSELKCIRIDRAEFEREFRSLSPVFRAMVLNLVRKIRHVTDSAYGRVQRED